MDGNLVAGYTPYAFPNSGSVGDSGTVSLGATAPSPWFPGQRVTSVTNVYDADGKQTKTTDANGLFTQTAHTDDELVASKTRTPNGAPSPTSGR